MKTQISLIALFIYITFQGLGQDKKYLATATTNENIINYVQSMFKYV